MDDTNQFIGRLIFMVWMVVWGIVWVGKKFAAENPDVAEAAKKGAEGKAISLINRILK